MSSGTMLRRFLTARLYSSDIFVQEVDWQTVEATCMRIVCVDFYCVSENAVHHSCIVTLNYYHIHAHIIVAWFLIITMYCHPAAE